MLADLVGLALLLGGVALAVIGLDTVRSTQRFFMHLSVAFAMLPIAALAAFIGENAVTWLAKYLSVAGVEQVELLAGHFINGSGDDATAVGFVDKRDILLIALLFYVAYAGNVVLKHLVTTVNLLKIGRRGMRC